MKLNELKGFSTGEKTEGLDKLNKLVKEHGSDLGTEEIFGRSAAVHMFSGPGTVEDGKLETIKLSDIIPTQDVIDPTLIAKMLKSSISTDESPEAIRTHGKLYLQDGHHRISAMILADRTTARILVGIK